MAEIKRVTLHPLNPDGSIDENTNLYPKALATGIVNENGDAVEIALKEDIPDLGGIYIKYNPESFTRSLMPGRSTYDWRYDTIGDDTDLWDEIYVRNIHFDSLINHSLTADNGHLKWYTSKSTSPASFSIGGNNQSPHGSITIDVRGKIKGEWNESPNAWGINTYLQLPAVGDQNNYKVLATEEYVDNNCGTKLYEHVLCIKVSSSYYYFRFTSTFSTQITSYELYKSLILSGNISITKYAPKSNVFNFYYGGVSSREFNRLIVGVGYNYNNDILFSYFDSDGTYRTDGSIYAENMTDTVTPL